MKNGAEGSSGDELVKVKKNTFMVKYTNLLKSTENNDPRVRLANTMLIEVEFDWNKNEELFIEFLKSDLLQLFRENPEEIEELKTSKQ